MRLKIGSIEIIDPTVEEFDELVRRYGQSDEITPAATKPTTSSNGVAADRVILERFVAAGSNGITTDDLGHLLGRRGRGVKPALDRWALRIKLISEDATGDGFEKARPEGGRGWRLRSALLPVAKALIG